MIERIDIPESPEEEEWLSKQNFSNSADDASDDLKYHLTKIIPRACIYNAIKGKHPDLALDIIVQTTFDKAHKAAELGAPELAQYSCDCDDIIYGNIPGIDFIRT